MFTGHYLFEGNERSVNDHSVYLKNGERLKRTTHTIYNRTMEEKRKKDLRASYLRLTLGIFEQITKGAKTSRDTRNL